MSERDEGFEQRVRATLNESVTALDADTRNRLAAGRARALTRTSWLTRWMPENAWMPATAVAALAVLAITLTLGRQTPDVTTQLAQIDAEFALELLLSEDDIAEMDADAFIQMEALLLLEDEQDAS